MYFIALLLFMNGKLMENKFSIHFINKENHRHPAQDWPKFNHLTNFCKRKMAVFLVIYALFSPLNKYDEYTYFKILFTYLHR